MGMLSAPPIASITSSLSYAASLFELTAAETEVDHPLCHDCAEAVIRKLDRQVKDAETELDVYKRQLQSLEAEPMPPAMDLAEYTATLEAANAEEEALKQELRSIEKERVDLRQQRAALLAERDELDRKEQSYWRDFNDFQLQLHTYESERDAVQRSIERYTEQLNMLRATNVLNDTFHIWHDGPFGTINGLRLGKHPGVVVEWAEINAAWGLTALLLDMLAKRYQFVFTGYRLLPMGSFSKIMKGSEESELYGSNEISLRKVFGGNLFDRGMIQFLHCVHEFAQFITVRDKELGQSDRPFHIPHAIQDDKINGISIKQGDDERWTKALKYLLTNLKFMVAWAAENQM
eukprot:TRINITY_DN2861_c0_g5_i1.p1 TRINITY_DN2861_c0_g5~~TRINITY_DN2861_c0_g5_i1.p1  ORF type:complete len:407 (-),score=84.73 TRINITY_DN2861_c0_g5_i1:49-1092(-)